MRKFTVLGKLISDLGKIQCGRGVYSSPYRQEKFGVIYIEKHGMRHYNKYR